MRPRNDTFSHNGLIINNIVRLTRLNVDHRSICK